MFILSDTNHVVVFASLISSIKLLDVEVFLRTIQVKQRWSG